jgi:flagellar basal-body rod protein FlgB
MIEPTAPIIERLMDMMAKRQQALSANLANVDTPGYRATDFSFDQELASAVSLTTTDPLHVNPAGDSGATRFEVGGELKPNGNDVNLERELTEQSKNAIQYMTLVQFLNRKIQTLRSSIKEGV